MQLMVMGRFALAESDTESPLHFELNLFGSELAGKALRLEATRQSTDEEQVLVFSPVIPGGELFPYAWQIFLNYTELGVEHIRHRP